MRTSAHQGYAKVPPLHHLPMFILISLRLGKLTSLESLYEACADEDICTPQGYAHHKICTP